MRLLHTSDWHLGRTFHGVGLEDAHAAYLDHLYEVARTERPDVIVVSGDIYDRALPHPRTVSLLDEALVRLLETGSRLVLTSGNHDSATRLSFGSRVMEHSGLHIRAMFEGVTRPVLIPRRDGNGVAGHVVALPYLEPSVAAPTFEATEPSHRAVLTAAIARARVALPQDGMPVVGMAHAFVAGATTTDSERDITVGGLGLVPRSVFDDFEYAALGHLHGAQTLSESVRYSGSPVAMSFSEASHTKGTWLVDIEPDRPAQAQFIEAPVYRQLAILRGDLDDLLADPSLEYAEDAWCQVTLTDEIRPASAMDRVRHRFPHAIRLQFDSPRSQDTPITYAERLKGRDDVELCCDFIAHVRGGRGPNASERTAIGAAVSAARQGAEEAPSDGSSMLPLDGLT